MASGTLFWSSAGVLLFAFSVIITAEDQKPLTNNNSNQHIITYLTRGATAPGSSSSSSSSSNPSSHCPKWLNCTAGFFDEGKDCKDESSSGSGGHRTNRVCTCIAHCCHAFDCRHWGRLVQCRRKCGAARPTRFGRSSSGSSLTSSFEQKSPQPPKCESKWSACERASRLDVGWDARGATDVQRNCIAHCCYAFDCRRALGYCRHACGVETWVTPRPLG